MQPPAADRPPHFDVLTIPRAPAWAVRSGATATMVLSLIALLIVSGTIAAAITAVTG